MAFDEKAVRERLTRESTINSKNTPDYTGIPTRDQLRFEVGWHRYPGLFETVEVQFHAHNDVWHLSTTCRRPLIPGSGRRKAGGGRTPLRYHPTIPVTMSFAQIEALLPQLKDDRIAGLRAGVRRQRSGLCHSCCVGSSLLNHIRGAHPAVWHAVAVELAATLLERGAKAARTRSSTVRAKALNNLTSAGSLIAMLEAAELPEPLGTHVEACKDRLIVLRRATDAKSADSADSDRADLTAKLRKHMRLSAVPVDDTPVACALPALAIPSGGDLFQAARAIWRVAGNERGEILVAPNWAWTWLIGKLRSTPVGPAPALVGVGDRDWLDEPDAWDQVMSLWDDTSDGPLASLLGAIEASQVLLAAPEPV